MSTNTSSYAICSAPNVYFFVYILKETGIAPLNKMYFILMMIDMKQSVLTQNVDKVIAFLSSTHNKTQTTCYEIP